MATGSSWPPRHVSLKPTARTRTRGPEATQFMNSYCRIVKDSVAGRSGELMVMRPWQEKLLDALLAEDPKTGLLRHRAALIGMARKNGKSGLGSGLALWGLFLGPHGGEVYSVAGTRDQARIVFGSAKRMVALDPELASIAKVYRDAIEVPSTGSIYRVLSAEAGTQEGLNPTLVLFDEVHVQPNAEMWDVMALAGGARVESLLVGITTAGSRTDARGMDSHCYQMFQHGRKVVTGETVDPSFFFAWWEPKLASQADHRDPKVWAEANPGIDDLCLSADFTATIGRTSEPEFRTKRTNVWVTSSSSALPHGAWDALADPERKPDPAVPVILMGDGSWSGDSTGIVACTVEERPHMWVVGLWEKNPDVPAWRVPIAEVEQTMREACRENRTLEAGMDPYRWQQSMQMLENEGLPMVEYPMGNAAVMVKAWKVFFDAVMDRRLTHSGDPRLARHVDAMALKFDSKGARPVKETVNSTKHIDLGVCAVAAVDRAVFNAGHVAVDLGMQVF